MKKTVAKKTKAKTRAEILLEREKIAKDSKKFFIELRKIKKDPNFDLLKWMRENTLDSGKKVNVLKMLKKIRG